MKESNPNPELSSNLKLSSNYLTALFTPSERSQTAKPDTPLKAITSLTEAFRRVHSITLGPVVASIIFKRLESAGLTPDDPRYLVEAKTHYDALEAKRGAGPAAPDSGPIPAGPATTSPPEAPSMPTAESSLKLNPTLAVAPTPAPTAELDPDVQAYIDQENAKANPSSASKVTPIKPPAVVAKTTPNTSVLSIVKPTQRTTVDIVASFNEHNAEIDVDGKVLYYDEATEHFYKEGDFLRKHRGKLVHTDDGKLKEEVEIWTHSPHRRQYSGIGLYDPAKCPKGYLNTWKGLPLTPKQGDYPHFKEFFANVICNGEEVKIDWLWKALAHKVQKPFVKWGVALLLRSGQGAGKNTLMDFLERIFGNYYIEITGSDVFTKQFNAITSGRLLIHGNEVFVEDSRDTGPLKRLITEKRQIVNQKYLPEIDQPSFTDYIFSTNRRRPIPLEGDDRRFVIYNVPVTHLDAPDYWAALQLELESGAPEAIYYDLLREDITGFIPFIRPKIRDGQDLTSLNRHPLEQFLAYCASERKNIFYLEDNGNAYVDTLTVKGTPRKDGPIWAKTILKVEFMAQFQQWADEHGKRYKQRGHESMSQILDLYLWERNKQTGGKRRPYEAVQVGRWTPIIEEITPQASEVAKGEKRRSTLVFPDNFIEELAKAWDCSIDYIENYF